MSGYQDHGNGTYFTFGNTAHVDIGSGLNQSTYQGGRHFQNAQHQSTAYDQSPTGMLYLPRIGSID